MRHDPVSGVILPSGETLTLFVTGDGYVWEGDRGTRSPKFRDAAWMPVNVMGNPTALDDAFEWLNRVG